MTDEQHDPIDVEALPLPTIEPIEIQRSTTQWPELFVDFIGGRNPNARAVAVTLLGLFCLINFIGMSAFVGDVSKVMGSVVMGVLVAELMITSTLTVLGRGNWIIRWCIGLLVEVTLLGAACLGLYGGARYGWHRLTDLVMMCVAFGPLLSAMAKLPLLSLQLVSGLCLRRPSHSDTDQRARQFSIGDMLGATAMMAVLLSVAQFGLDRRAGWTPLLIACGLAGLLGMLVGVPATFAAFRNPNRAFAALVMVPYAVVLAILVTAVVGMMFPPRGENMFLVILPIAVTACVTTLWLLSPLHGCGYELRRAGKADGEPRD